MKDMWLVFFIIDESANYFLGKLINHLFYKASENCETCPISFSPDVFPNKQPKTPNTQFAIMLKQGNAANSQM